MSKPIKVTDSNFNEFINKHKIVIVDCWASWCAPCTILSPIIEELAEERDEVVFGKLNVDKNMQTPMKFGIMSIPTLLYFKNGELVDKTLGALPKRAVEERINNIVS